MAQAVRMVHPHPMSIQSDQNLHPSVARWLILIAGMIVCTVILGGLTRLTESGLSMTEWRPVFGWLPPLDDAAWQRLFELYKKTPQYQQVFPNLTLAGFKAIFWFEYLHRLLGRLIGAVFLIGFLYFLVRGRISRFHVPQLVMLFVLGGLQGALGWYMVASGLVDRPTVSHYRLAAHLTLAIALYAWIVWILTGRRRQTVSSFAALPAGHMLALTSYAAILLTIVFGAFVAGLDAGKIYNTFPTMGGAWLPDDYFRNGFSSADIVANPVAVQFNHRLLAIITVVLVVMLWGKSVAGNAIATKRSASFLLLAVLLQAGLGIATLLLIVPVWLAALHQAGALLLVTAAVIDARRRFTPT